MNLLRKGIVHLLAVILFFSLLGGVNFIGINANLSKPDKLEGWLKDSKIYDGVIDSALDQASKDGGADTTNDGSVSLNDPAVRQAAKESFSPELLSNSANTFLSSNYDWLSGKTATPTFVIDLSTAKQDFAQRVGKAAESHLDSLAVCSTAELAQIQLPANPLTITCRPANLDPKTEGQRVTTELTNGDFLDKPIITAQTLSQGDKNSSTTNKPYYQKLSQAPKVFKLAKNLPLIFFGIALISTLGIIFISPKRRRGVRRFAVVLFEVGIVLVVTKFATSILTSHVQKQLIRDGTISDKLKQPVTDLMQTAQSHLTQYNLIFGIIFILVALIIFVRLYKTREGSDKPKKPAMHSKKDLTESLPETSPVEPETPAHTPRPLTPTQSAVDRIRRSTDGDRTQPTSTPPLGKNPPKPKRPKLIQ